MTDHPTDRGLLDETADLCAWLADITGRLRRFEPVPDAELAAFKARKETVVEQIEPGFYESRGWRL